MHKNSSILVGMHSGCEKTVTGGFDGMSFIFPDASRITLLENVLIVHRVSGAPYRKVRFPDFACVWFFKISD
jgi:hypothetical protein